MHAVFSILFFCGVVVARGEENELSLETLQPCSPESLGLSLSLSGLSPGGLIAKKGRGESEFEQVGKDATLHVLGGDGWKACLKDVGEKVGAHIKDTLKNGPTIKKELEIDPASFGHGRYAPEYAALCGVYNLIDAVNKQGAQENRTDWKTLIGKLEYLAISLAPNDTWCKKEEEPKGKEAKKTVAPNPAPAKTGSLFSAFMASKAQGEQKTGAGVIKADGMLGKIVIEDCQKKIDKVRAAEKVEVKDKEAKKGELEKVGGLWLNPPVLAGHARQIAFAKVARLLEKAHEIGEAEKYPNENELPTQALWNNSIKAKIDAIASEIHAMSIGNNAKSDDKEMFNCASGNGGDPKKCPKNNAANRAIMCMPKMAYKKNSTDNTPPEAKKHFAPQVDGELAEAEKFRAGTNILVDMACLCIPGATEVASSPCTGSGKIKNWKGEETAQVNDEGADTQNIKQQIRQLIAGCKAKNTYGKITSHTIGQALDNFMHALGRWKHEEDKYELAAPGNGYKGVLGMMKTGDGVCNGNEFGHCVYYGEMDTSNNSQAGDKRDFVEPTWYNKLTDAKSTLETYEQNLQKTSTIAHKIEILTQSAIQARDEALIAGDFGDNLKDFCAKQNEEKCTKNPFCSWNGTVCAAPSFGQIHSSPDAGEYAAKQAACEKLDENACANDAANNCAWSENKCSTTVRAPSSGAEVFRLPFFIPLLVL